VIPATEKDDALIFAVRVVARALRSELAGEHDGALKLRVAAPPVEGAANEELRRTLARTLGVPVRNVEIISGETSKTKRVRVHGVTKDALLKLLN
jgi:uncharacterized protein (TIGR00251 family)